MEQQYGEPINARTDHGCFGCGDLNPAGLHLRFYRSGDDVVTTFTPGPAHEGYNGMVQGGIVSTLLDEAMSWAIIDLGKLVVTGRMTIEFRRPVPIGRPVNVRAHVVRDRSRAVETYGDVRDQDGALLASATALFVRAPEPLQEEWRANYFNQSAD